MTLPATSRVIEVTDSERRILLRLLGDSWFTLDRDREKTQADLVEMSDIESLQRKLV